MKEVVGDLWDYYKQGYNICITTNGFVKKNGDAVMGRGCAKEAAVRFPNLPGFLGSVLEREGNHVALLQSHPMILTFPVKHNFYEEADLDLIKRSAEELVKDFTIYYESFKEEGGLSSYVVIPRPGCGNGRLSWVDVKLVLEPILDDRFLVISKK